MSRAVGEGRRMCSSGSFRAHAPRWGTGHGHTPARVGASIADWSVESHQVLPSWPAAVVRMALGHDLHGG